MIGDGLAYDSRASGVSGNGEVLFGWVGSDMGYWRPIIWHDNTYSLLAGDESGEAMCASDEGTYVAGKLDWNAFYWSEEEGMVTFGNDQDFPTIIMEDGSIFGFNTVFPPTNRVAFYRDTLGNMMSFNDYAESRGMENAQEWSFYSINDVTPNGNKFIGAGVNPDGQDVSFLIEFSDEIQTYSLNLLANPTEGGELTGGGEFEAGMSVDIEALANENYEFINWTNESGDIISNDPATTITMMDINMTLTANFQSTVGLPQFEVTKINIYPNPATDVITLNVNHPASVFIMDVNGKVLAKEFITKKSDIGIENLNRGVYFVIVNTTEGSTLHKLVKK